MTIPAARAMRPQRRGTWHAPPHVKARRDPQGDRQADDVDDHAPGAIEEPTVLFEAAAGVHAGQELIPAEPAIFDGEAAADGVRTPSCVDFQNE